MGRGRFGKFQGLGFRVSSIRIGIMEKNMETTISGSGFRGSLAKHRQN